MQAHSRNPPLSRCLPCQSGRHITVQSHPRKRSSEPLNCATRRHERANRSGAPPDPEPDFRGVAGTPCPSRSPGGSIKSGVAR